MPSRVSRVLKIACLAVTTTAERPASGGNALMAAAIAAQQLARLVGTHSTFARAEDSEVAEATTGYLLSTPEHSRPDRFIVSESNAAEMIESTAVAIRSMLKDLTAQNLHAPRTAEKHAPESEPSESSLAGFQAAAAWQRQEQATDCWVEGTWLEATDVSTTAASAGACHQQCLENPQCNYFSYRYGTGDCALSSDIRRIEKEAGTITGPATCDDDNNSTSRRRLAQEDCLVADMAIQGTRTSSVFNIPSSSSCQNLCRAQSSCQYFTWTTEMCALYSAAEGVVVQEGAVCGPRSCDSPHGSQNQGSEPSLEGASAGDDTLLYDADGATATAAGGGGTAESSGAGGGGGLLGALFGGLGGGSRTEEAAVEGLGIGGAVQAGMGAMNSIGSVLAAADTVMNTIPIAEMVNTGMALANSGIFSGSGVTNRNPDSSAPEGIENPSVTCLSEGLRCCIPRLAAPNYKKNPPTLNGNKATECQTTYVSTTDQLCATTLYNDTLCGISVLETSSLTIYRHVIHTPSSNMNNAICECAVSKSINDDGTRTVTASGKWEYSLAAADAAAEKQQKVGDTVDNLSQVARAGVKWLDALSGAGVSTTGSGGSATGFISSILDLTENVRSGSKKRSLSADEGGTTAAATVALQPRSCSLWPLRCSRDWQAALAAEQCRGLLLLDAAGCPALPDLAVEAEYHSEMSAWLHCMKLPPLAALEPQFFPGNPQDARLVCEFATVLAENVNAGEGPSASCAANGSPTVARHVLATPVLQEMLGGMVDLSLSPTTTLRDAADSQAPVVCRDVACEILLPLPTGDTTSPNSRLSVLYRLEPQQKEAQQSSLLAAVPLDAVQLSV